MVVQLYSEHCCVIRWRDESSPGIGNVIAGKLSVPGVNQVLFNRTTGEDCYADVLLCGLQLADAMTALDQV
jgi:hypothetical protein